LWGGLGAGDEDDLFEAGLLGHGAGADEVADVDGVEAAAEMEDGQRHLASLSTIREGWWKHSGGGTRWGMTKSEIRMAKECRMTE